jgi:prepilin-type N-terminal cleavage/methylation domain-containing protein
MHTKKGFTIIELMVTIIIIALLATIATISLLNVQKQARDSRRSSNAATVAENLEKYFTKNGEYPSVQKVINSAGSSVQSLLGLPNGTALLDPSASSGTSNSWKTGAASSSLRLTYSGNNDNSASCTTGNTATDSCTDFKIQYYNEQDGTITTITSRHASTTLAQLNPTNPAGAVTVTVSAGINISWTAGTCASGTPRYAYQSRTNDGTWSGWSGWQTTRSTATTPSDGTKFGYQVKYQCYNTTYGTYGSDSPTSAEATYISPVTTIPSAPTVYVTGSFRPYAINGGICIDAASAGGPGTRIQIYGCNGSNAQDWELSGKDGTIRPTYNMGLCLNHNGRGVQLTVETCNGSNMQQWTRSNDGVFHSTGSGYCIDDANFGTGNGNAIQSWDCSGNTAQIWNPSDTQNAWTWADVTCNGSAVPQYQVNYQQTNVADSGWSNIGASTRIVRTTVNQGYMYTTQAQARCASPYASGGWSTTAQAQLPKAVIPPGPAYNWSFGEAAGRTSYYFYYTVPACGAGTIPQERWDGWIGTNNNAGGNSMYWMDKGPGNIYWYGLDTNWYNDLASGTQSYNNMEFMGASTPYNINVMSSAYHRCTNTVTGWTAYGSTSQSPQYNT